MLVITRSANEKVMLGNDIEVKVVGISGNKVRIGFTTPRTMDIYREEIFLKIQKEKNSNTKK